MTHVEKLEEKGNGIVRILLQTEELRIIVTNLGCQILSIFMKDKLGQWDDIVLGPMNPEIPSTDNAYMGAIVGRVANRVRNGEFILNGIRYSLCKNSGNSHLHGGIEGFNTKMFEWKLAENGVCFRYLSSNMEEGYPGNLWVEVTYILSGDTFSANYRAQSDQDTLVNLTNHTYFNLLGQDETVLEHFLQIDADYYMPVDEENIPTGERLPVYNTAFDFTTPKCIGDQMFLGTDDLRMTKGFDHPYILNSKNSEIILHCDATGRRIIITTDMPMVQIYTGNYLSQGAIGKKGTHYKDFGGIALETELCPDAIHLEENPSVILRKNDFFCSTTKYRFEVINNDN